VFSMASIQMALHYVGSRGIGARALAAQVVSYFALIELGVSAAIYRELIKYKDDRTIGAIFLSRVRTPGKRASELRLIRGSLRRLLSVMRGNSPACPIVFTCAVRPRGNSPLLHVRIHLQTSMPAAPSKGTRSALAWHEAWGLARRPC